MKQKIIRILGPVFGAWLFALAIFVLHRELKKYGLHQIGASLAAIPAARIAWAALFAALCYLALTFYDTLALRYLKNPLPYRRIARASFVGYAFSHNVGLSLVTSVPMKYRFYSTWGLKAVDVVKVAAFCGMTFWTGFMTLAGATLFLEPERVPALFDLPIADARLIGLFFLGLIAAYLVFSTRGRSLKLGRHTLLVPRTRFAMGQILASCLEWCSASAVLFFLLPPIESVSSPTFLSLFLFAYVAGFVSQVPGGLGVFESVILLALKDAAPTPAIMGALLAYRAIYYIVPLIAAIGILVVHEGTRRRR